MEARQLGNAGIKISAIGLGCNNLGHIEQASSRDLLHRAIHLGVNFFDTADVYAQGRAEEEMGRWLTPFRHDIHIATKFGYPGRTSHPGSRKQVFASADSSLSRLRSDYIDLYQMHFPDPATPIEETLDALTELVRLGKVRFIGCCNFALEQIADALNASDAGRLSRFVSGQGELNLLNRNLSESVLSNMLTRGVGFLPFFPLASGLLSGTCHRDDKGQFAVRERVVRDFRQRFDLEMNWQRVELLAQLCKEFDIGMLPLALSWLLDQPAVSSVIAGATSAQQLEMNVRAGEARVSPEKTAVVIAALNNWEANHKRLRL